MTPVETFRGRTVALFGLGGSGLASAGALRAGGCTPILWDDGAAAVEKARAAGFRVEDLRRIDWRTVCALILAPGVPLTHPAPHWSVECARAAGVEVIGDIELFCRERRARAAHASFIAITGTNGKSTTTALIAHLLARAGRDVQLGGNIGTPILELDPPAPQRHHVIELSSYQIDLTPSLAPSIGVLLNLSPDHIDRHGTMEHYAAVKARLIEASEVAVVGVDDPFCAALAQRRAGAGGGMVPVSFRPGPEGGVMIAGRDILACGAKARRLAALEGIGALRGDHNAQNAAMAVVVALACGLSEVEIQAGLQSFLGLAHRMEELGRIGAALVVNDSKATNADSTQKALAAFEGGIFWIAGGRPKAGGIAALAPYFGRIEKAYLIGEAAEAFAGTLAGKVPHVLAGTLEAALRQAAAEVIAAKYPQPVILFSPSCASFDQFPNFEVRGDTFRALASSLPGFVGR